MSKAYSDAGVDINKGYESVERIKKHVGRTFRPEVMTQLGSFGAMFKPDLGHMTSPVLVSGTDGVGTKILLAQQADKLDTIGIDCVAMCVNDILAQGAEPLFFLDYLAVGKNHPEKIEAIVSGVAQGCVEAKAALIGGETAEMPDLYHEDEFDLAGFSVGIVDQDDLLDGSKVVPGDVLIGLPSSGIHSNGYSFVRKVFFKDHQWKFEDKLPSGKQLIDELLMPTKIYVEEVLPLLKENKLHGIAHITGGGFYENLPRMFNDECGAIINSSQWTKPEIFKVIQALSQVDDQEMFNIFNMGIGMVLATSKEYQEEIIQRVEGACVIGEIVVRDQDQASLRIEGLQCD